MSSRQYERYSLAETAEGLSKPECELRKHAWQQENGDTVAEALQLLAKEGKHGDIRLSCEPLRVREKPSAP